MRSPRIVRNESLKTLLQMGKILVRAQQQNIYNLGGDGQMTKAYVLRPVRYSTMKSDDVVNYCAQN